MSTLPTKPSAWAGEISIYLSKDYKMLMNLGGPSPSKSEHLLPFNGITRDKDWPQSASAAGRRVDLWALLAKRRKRGLLG